MTLHLSWGGEGSRFPPRGRGVSLAPSAEDPLPEGIPGRGIPFGIDRVNGCFAESFFAMFNHGVELRQRH